jgi:hypothetical protein
VLKTTFLGENNVVEDFFRIPRAHGNQNTRSRSFQMNIWNFSCKFKAIWETALACESEVTTSVPECHVNGMWERVGRASGGFWLVSPFPPPLYEWHSDALSCHLSARGMINEKKQGLNLSWHCPFNPLLGGSLANPDGTACGSISPAFLRATMLPGLYWKLFCFFFFVVFTALYDIIFQLKQFIQRI